MLHSVVLAFDKYLDFFVCIINTFFFTMHFNNFSIYDKYYVAENFPFLHFMYNILIYLSILILKM